MCLAVREIRGWELNVIAHFPAVYEWWKIFGIWSPRFLELQNDIDVNGKFHPSKDSVEYRISVNLSLSSCLILYMIPKMDDLAAARTARMVSQSLHVLQ
jgi:hypothetical protein